MSEEEKQAIIHLLDKQARYEYAKNNGLSFKDEDYEAYIIRQSMINKDKEIERLKKSEKEALDTLESATYENINLTNEVDRLNNIINECAEDILKEIQENHHLSCGVALTIRQKLIDYREIKGDGSNE